MVKEGYSRVTARLKRVTMGLQQGYSSFNMITADLQQGYSRVTTGLQQS